VTEAGCKGVEPSPSNKALDGYPASFREFLAQACLSSSVMLSYACWATLSASAKIVDSSPCSIGNSSWDRNVKANHSSPSLISPSRHSFSLEALDIMSGSSEWSR